MAFILNKAHWSFKTRCFEVRWNVKKDEPDIRGMDSILAAECMSNIVSGKWQCFSSEVVVIHRSSGAIVSKVTRHRSIYESATGFRDHFGRKRKGQAQSLFADIVRQAIADARANFGKIQAELLAIRLRPSQQEQERLAA